MSSGLGQSQTYISTVPYSTFYNAWVATSKTTNDVIAVANVSGGASNPVNGGASITASLPLFRALGFSANPPGSWDSTVSVNISLINLTRTSIDPSKYDLQAVVTHEMDEVLGTPSGVGESTIQPADLFRYTLEGTRTYTTAGDDAYLSIDGGVTDLARYNQNANGDYGDFWSISNHSPVRVQDAFGTPGSTPDLGVELTLLDVLGWDFVAANPAPQPVLSATRCCGNTVLLAWNSVANRNYQLQYSTNLSQGLWVNLGNAITANATTTSYVDTMTNDPQRFYQVELLPIGNAPVARSSKKATTGPVSLRKHVTAPQSGAVSSARVTPAIQVHMGHPVAVPAGGSD